MVHNISRVRLASFLIAIYLNPVHSDCVDFLSIRFALRLRGGSRVESCYASIPNPRLYKPPRQLDVPEILTDIVFVSEKGQRPEDVKECKVIGSWSNWELQESLKFDVASGVWQIEKLLSPGEYHMKFIVDDQWTCSAKHERKLDEGGFVNNVIVVKDSAVGTDYALRELTGNSINELQPSEHDSVCTAGEEVLKVEQPANEAAPDASISSSTGSQTELASDNISVADEVPQILSTKEHVPDVQSVSCAHSNDTISEVHIIPETALPISSPNTENDVADDVTPLVLSAEVHSGQAAIDPVPSNSPQPTSDLNLDGGQDIQEALRQDAAILELQQSLLQARAHAKQLLGRVAELEKARSCEETGGDAATLPEGPLSSAIKKVLEVAQHVFASCLPSPILQGNIRVDQQQRGCCDKGAVRGGGPSLSVARQLDNLWVRLRGGNRSGHVADARQDELDRMLKQAGTQAAQALSRIEALEASIALLAGEPGPAFSWEATLRP